MVKAELSNDTLLNIRKMQSSFPTLVGYSLHFARETISSFCPLLPPRSFIASPFFFFHKNEFPCVELLFTSIEFCPRHLSSWMGRSILEIRKSLSFPFFFFFFFFFRWNLFSRVKVSSIRMT